MAVEPSSEGGPAGVEHVAIEPVRIELHRRHGIVELGIAGCWQTVPNPLVEQPCWGAGEMMWVVAEAIGAAEITSAIAEPPTIVARRRKLRALCLPFDECGLLSE